MENSLPTLEGNVYSLGEIKEFKNDFKKREVLIETKREYSGKEYSEVIKVIADGKRVDTTMLLSVGDMVEIGYVLSGRMWTSPDGNEVNFTEVKAIWIEKKTVIASAPSQPAQAAQQQTASQTVSTVPVEDDDLPF